MFRQFSILFLLMSFNSYASDFDIVGEPQEVEFCYTVEDSDQLPGNVSLSVRMFKYINKHNQAYYVLEANKGDAVLFDKIAVDAKALSLPIDRENQMSWGYYSRHPIFLRLEVYKTEIDKGNSTGIGANFGFMEIDSTENQPGRMQPRSISRLECKK